ncbi:MAG TPA: cation transporter [Desulfuromonadales bacterium]|nr:cation transporter [Desulfuromonadales bacterium]
MKFQECESCGTKSARWSFVGNLLAAIFKVLLGTITGSKGLVADGVHSGADALSSLLILVALNISSRPPSERHPFGYGKIEYISTLCASLFLFVGASSIFIDALHTFGQGVETVPSNAALLATLLSLVFSYLMYTSNKCAGTQLGSPALLADANESKADSVSSLAVLLGLIGTKMGFIYADTAAAAFVSLFIFRMSVEMFFQGIHGLIDTAMDKEDVDQIIAVSLEIEGVEGVRSVKSRRMGQKSWVDIVIDVSMKKSVLETHIISGHVQDLVMEKVDGIAGVSVSTFPINKWGLGS